MHTFLNSPTLHNLVLYLLSKKATKNHHHVYIYKFSHCKLWWLNSLTLACQKPNPKLKVQKNKRKKQDDDISRAWNISYFKNLHQTLIPRQLMTEWNYMKNLLASCNGLYIFSPNHYLLYHVWNWVFLMNLFMFICCTQSLLKPYVKLSMASSKEFRV